MASNTNMGLCVARAPIVWLGPLASLWEYIVSLNLFSLAMFSLKRSGAPIQKTWAVSLLLCTLAVWSWQKQSHLATGAKWRKRFAGKLSDLSVRENTSHEGEEEGGKWGLRISTENVFNGNWANPLGMMSLLSSFLRSFKASDTSTKLSSEHHQ